MQSSLVQMVALTCHGNAVLRGIEPRLPRQEGTVSVLSKPINFIDGRIGAMGEVETYTLASSAEEWIGGLKERGIRGLRLRNHAQNQPLSDRLSDVFQGGGRQWKIEGLRNTGGSEFWLSRWDFLKRGALDGDWKVTYGLCELAKTEPAGFRTLEEIAADLRVALEEIKAFDEAQNCGFGKHFVEALRDLDGPAVDAKFWKYFCPRETLPQLAENLLEAAISAWVFGGMNSWNDMGFDGEIGTEYERISDRLYSLLNEAVEAAASSSLCSLT